ncbi:helix-turn-helix transcriptional regulator [Brumimicrobium aurantiacum]|uniref:WYL domain-containing protein n=1 Tax=Brumimicrobium aurantiacum TaxID=1737063 RepID=A0A3E1EZM1_9FLAO|nr:WYL domain-containing protein [Brumimicrobium aurantiacum]RFC55019.1 WYL domain-containing protein [Brumimicrobium aurantiacum]
MSAQAIIRRYKRIIDLIETGQFPSMDEIMEYIERIGLKASKRTVERDFEAIRNEFNVEIEYNSINRGYFINREKSLAIDSFLRLLELVETANVFQESLKESKETLNYIDFEYEGNVSGIEFLQDILMTIRNCQRIRFQHDNYHSGKSKKYQMKPYLIKEYQGRWYVVGVVSGMEEVRTFGLDRISELEILTKTFVPDQSLNLKERFHDVVGLTYSLSELTRIVIAVKSTQIPYLKSLPLHHSQKILEEKDGETLVEYYLKPNYEFSQLLFMHMDRLRVLEPDWLVEEMNVMLEKMRAMYAR